MLLSLSILLLCMLFSITTAAQCPAHCDCASINDTSSLKCTLKFLQTWPSLSNNCELKTTSLKLIHDNTKEKEILLTNFISFREFIQVPKCLQSLNELDLSGLRLAMYQQFESLICNIFAQFNHLMILNLASNNIFQFPPKNCSVSPLVYGQLVYLNLSHNNIVEMSVEELTTAFSRLGTLDLSHNYQLLLLPEKLRERNITLNLTIHGYSVVEISPFNFPTMPDLRSLDLSNSPHLKSFSSPLFEGFMPNIEQLILRNCTSLREIKVPNFHHSSHYNNLTYLDVSSCPHLTELDLSDSPKLERLFLTNTPLTVIRPPVHSRLLTNSALIVIDLGTSSNWNCSCDILWLTRIMKFNSLPNNAVCSWPPYLKNKPLPIHLDECSPPAVGNCSMVAHKGLRLTEEVIFDCDIEGSPSPDLLWVTPSGEQFVFRKIRQKIYPSISNIETRQFHSEHRWHKEEEYFSDMDRRRFFILNPLGSLYIDYLTREDPGVYRLYVTSPLGNATRNLTLCLDGSVLYSIRTYSLFSGLFTAILVLMFGLCTAIGRYISTKCSRDEREKRHSLRKLIASIEAYRINKTDQFRSYRHQHMDRWRGNYHNQKTKLKDLVTSYTVAMQETYYRRIARIRENCESRVDRLRDSYQAQRFRIKDYRSNQVERLRENYQQQTLKIREYAADQMDRLREHYRLQQQHLTKLLELLSLENCIVGNGLKDGEIDLQEFSSNSEDRLTPLLHRLETLNVVPEEDDFPEELCILKLPSDELTISIADSDDFVTADSFSDNDGSNNSELIESRNSLIRKNSLSQAMGSDSHQLADM